jgi:hypothetical protein
MWHTYLCHFGIHMKARQLAIVVGKSCIENHPCAVVLLLPRLMKLRIEQMVSTMDDSSNMNRHEEEENKCDN